MWGTFKEFIRTIKDIFPYIWGQGWQGKIFTVTATTTILGSISLRCIGPFFLSNAINAMLPSQALNSVSIYGNLAVFTSMMIGAELLDAAGKLIFTRLSGEASRLLEVRVAEHLNHLPMSFHTQKNTGAISRAFSSIYQSMNFFVYASLSVVPLFLQATAITGILFAFGWPEGVVMLASVGGFGVILALGSKKSSEILQTMYEYVFAAADKINENLLYNELVRATNNVQFDLAEFNNLLRQRAAYYFRSNAVFTAYATSSTLLIQVGFLGAVMLAGYQVLNYQINTGDFVLITTLVAMVIPALTQLNLLGDHLINSVVGIQELLNYLKVAREPDDSHLPEVLFYRSTIKMENVSFRYEDNAQDILHNLSLTISAGKKIAIVGQSGQGKSTIAKLLMRFSEVTQGNIYIDGQDIREFRRQSWRENIAYVQQDTPIFNDTIRNNIRYGNHKASEEDYQQALRESCLDEWIQSLPEKDQTKAGERGMQISGGEKQRIAIARALLLRPSLYIFDEATSSLDNKTERTIQNVIDAVTQKATSLTIAHRLSTIKNADEIIVLKNHTIVERGTHATLIAARGEYFEMWQQQHHMPDMRSMPVITRDLYRAIHPTIQNPLLMRKRFGSNQISVIVNSLGTTIDNFYKVIFQLGEVQQNRVLVWNEIYEALRRKNIDPAQEFNALYTGFQQDILSKTEREEQHQLLVAYCKRLSVFQDYIDQCFSKNLIGYKCLLLFCENSKITINVWGKAEEDNVLTLKESHVAPGSRTIVHLLLGNNCFEYSFLMESSLFDDKLYHSPEESSVFIPSSRNDLFGRLPFFQQQALQDETYAVHHSPDSEFANTAEGDEIKIQRNF